MAGGKTSQSNIQAVSLIRDLEKNINLLLHFNLQLSKFIVVIN